MPGGIKPLLVAILSITSATCEAGQSFVQYWNDTGLTFAQFISEVAANNKCESTLNAFVGCVRAVETILNYKNDRYRLLPRKIFKNNSEDATVRDLGFGKIVVTNTEGLPDRELASTFEQELDLWGGVYRLSVADGAIDFVEIFNWAYDYAGFEQKEEAAVTALAFEDFFHATEDMHTNLQPTAYLNEQQQNVYNNVKTKVLKHYTEEIGYIKVSSLMSEVTCEQVANAVYELSASNVQAFILDLRGNGGGLVYNGVCVADIFANTNPDQTLLELRYVPALKLTPLLFKAQRAQLTDLPMVVLQDAGTASASEIIAGILQDLNRAVIVGSRSYGKGVVQSVFPWIENEGTSFARVNKKISKSETIAFYHLPSGRSPQFETIIPDIFVNTDGEPYDDNQSEREQDYMNAPRPATAASWQQPHPEYIATLKKCMRFEGLSQGTTAAVIPTDKQMLKAEEAVHCMVTRTSRAPEMADATR